MNYINMAASFHYQLCSRANTA